MLSWEQAEAALRVVQDACPGDADCAELKRAFIASALRYARLRADWAVADTAARMTLDDERTVAHNALIDACNILTRYMARKGQSVVWRQQLSGDRKLIGDFACYVHAILGIGAR